MRSARVNPVQAGAEAKDIGATLADGFSRTSGEFGSLSSGSRRGVRFGSRMPIEPDAEIFRLRTALRDLAAMSTMPAAWAGREPSDIAAGLADVLIGSLHLDFAFVRLCDPTRSTAVEVTRGHAWKAFPEWRQGHLAAARSLARREIIPDVGGGAEPCRGLVVPIGVN